MFWMELKITKSIEHLSQQSNKNGTFYWHNTDEKYLSNIYSTPMVR